MKARTHKPTVKLSPAGVMTVLSIDFATSTDPTREPREVPKTAKKKAKK